MNAHDNSNGDGNEDATDDDGPRDDVARVDPVTMPPVVAIAAVLGSFVASIVQHGLRGMGVIRWRRCRTVRQFGCGDRRCGHCGRRAGERKLGNPAHEVFFP